MTDDRNEQTNTDKTSTPAGSDFADAIVGAFGGSKEDEARAANGFTRGDGASEPETEATELRSPVVAVDDRYRLLPDRLELGGPVPSPKRPDAVARLLLHLLAETGVHLKHWRDEWYLWREQRTGGAYSRMAGADNRYAVPDAVRGVLSDAQYEAATKDGVELRDWNPTGASVREVVDAMAAQSRPFEDLEPGTWLADPGVREAQTPGAEVTCVANGLLWSPREGGARGRALMPHTPEFFTDTAVAVAWEPEAACPRWMRFLEELWPGDAESQALLQEWFGYVLAGSTSLHKILTLVGPPRSGKSTIAWVLEALLGGSRQVDHPTMARLAEPFGLASMLGKRLAVVGDARIAKTDAGIVERLLMISGEDPVTVQRKYMSDVTVTLDTRIMIVSNAMPDLRDMSGALASRFLPLSIRIDGFLGSEDFGLKRALEAELPGVLRWALEGADRLWERGGRFTIGERVRESMDEVERQASPIKAFAGDRLVFDPAAVALKDDVYGVYELWCADAGYHPKGKNVFFRDLLSAYPGKLETGKNTVDGRQRPTVRGVSIGSEN